MPSNNSTASRLISIRKQQKLSQKDFAKQIGITQGALSQLENNKSTLSLPTIRQISRVYGIDCNYLVHGTFDKNNMPTTIENVETNNKQEYKQFPVNTLVPLVDQEAHAGYIKDSSDPDYLSSLGVYKIPGFESGDYRMFEIEGDSMLPTIHPREIVVTELLPSLDEFENGTLSVVITDDGIVAKRLYRYEKEKDKIILKSDNPDYKTYSLTHSEIKEIWTIKAKITNVLASDAPQNIERLDSIESELQLLKKKINELNAN